MVCFSPISIRNPNSKNVANRLTVPCGKCYACRMNLRMSWTYRLLSELSVSKSAVFLTLTYSDEKLPEDGVLVKTDLQSFFKRVRKYTKMRYFAVGEYGEETKRPHYHVLMFNYGLGTLDKIINCWKEGFVSTGYVEQASIHYCTKDMMKDSTKEAVNGVKGFRLMSSRPGLGSESTKFLMNQKLNNDFTVQCGGVTIAMPRYYREKVFSYKQLEEHQKEMIEFTDRMFLETKENLESQGIENFFTYIEKERQGLINQQIKKRKLRKL